MNNLLRISGGVSGRASRIKYTYAQGMHVILNRLNGDMLVKYLKNAQIGTPFPPIFTRMKINGETKFPRLNSPPIRRRRHTIINHMMSKFLPVMVKCDAIEVLKGIRHRFPRWSCQPGVQRYPLGLCRAADINTTAFFDIPEVDSIGCSALVWYHGRFHVANKCPLCGTEERMSFHVRSACACS